MPFYKLWVEIEKTYTSGDGYLDKLCMELVGSDSPLPAADARRSRQITRALPEKCSSRLAYPGAEVCAAVPAYARPHPVFKGKQRNGRLLMTNTTRKTAGLKLTAAARRGGRRHGVGGPTASRAAFAADKVILRTNWLFYGSHSSSSTASTRAIYDQNGTRRRSEAGQRLRQRRPPRRQQGHHLRLRLGRRP
jgi:hypothetical protein